MSLPERFRYPNLPADLIGYRVKVQGLKGAWWYTVKDQRGDYLFLKPTAANQKPVWNHKRHVIDCFKLT